MPEQPLRTEVLDALVPLLTDPDPEVRGSAIQSVATVAAGVDSRYARIVPALLAAVRDPSTRCRSLELSWAEANGLDFDSSGELLAAGGKLQVVAMLALGNLGEGAATAVPDLVRALHEDDPMVRWFALQALGPIGTKAAPAVPELIAILESGGRKPAGSDDPGAVPWTFTTIQFRVTAKSWIMLG